MCTYPFALVHWLQSPHSQIAPHCSRPAPIDMFCSPNRWTHSLSADEGRTRAHQPTSQPPPSTSDARHRSKLIWRATTTPTTTTMGSGMTQKALQAINFFPLLQDDILIIGCTEQRVPAQPSPAQLKCSAYWFIRRYHRHVQRRPSKDDQTSVDKGRIGKLPQDECRGAFKVRR